MPSAKPAQRRKTAPKATPSPRNGRKRIVVLSRNAKLYSTSRFVEAGKAHGHSVRIVDTLACSLVVERGRPTILYEGKELTDVDVVIPRIGASITNYGLAVVSQFEAMGIPTVNSSMAIGRSRDKLRCLQALSQAGIDVPRTVMAHGKADVRDAVKRVGGLPAIVKLTQGTQGIGVMIAHSMAEIGSMLDTLWDLGQEIILQEFIAESKGRDVRVLVVGGQAVGAMRRTAKKGEFRSNIHRGGEGEAIELPPAYAKCAVEAARAVGLNVAGVDLLEAKSGPKVMEVNSSPGFEGLEAATGIDVSALIIREAERLANEAALRAATLRG
jgi:ribosomal protein S6--L-glutamate ligase